MKENDINKWDRRFFDLAKHVSSWSKDKSTKTGAVIVKDRQVLSLGYNGFPRGVNDDIEERHDRPAKYAFTEHGERNAIYNAISNGIPLKGSTIYSTFFPCIDCCRAIIQTGIVEVVTPNPVNASDVWKESFKLSLELFNEVGINIKYIPFNEINVDTILTKDNYEDFTAFIDAEFVRQYPSQGSNWSDLISKEDYYEFYEGLTVQEVIKSEVECWD